MGSITEAVFYGRGTISNPLLKFFGATELRREVIVTIFDSQDETSVYNALLGEFKLYRKHKGIAFSIPLKSVLSGLEKTSAENQKTNLKRRSKGKYKYKEETMEYEAIFVIVNKGMSAEVIEAADKAGSTGGTIIHGRGSGTEEKARLFNIEIEPEKDIVLILAKTDDATIIMDSINSSLQIDQPGTGIIFTMPVSRTLGLYKKS